MSVTARRNSSERGSRRCPGAPSYVRVDAVAPAVTGPVPRAGAAARAALLNLGMAVLREGGEKEGRRRGGGRGRAPPGRSASLHAAEPPRAGERAGGEPAPHATRRSPALR